MNPLETNQRASFDGLVQKEIIAIIHPIDGGDDGINCDAAYIAHCMEAWLLIFATPEHLLGHCHCLRVMYREKQHTRGQSTSLLCQGFVRMHTVRQQTTCFLSRYLLIVTQDLYATPIL